MAHRLLGRAVPHERRAAVALLRELVHVTGEVAAHRSEADEADLRGRRHDRDGGRRREEV